MWPQGNSAARYAALQPCNAADRFACHLALLPLAYALDLETRLLIVDDDPGIRELTAGFLTQPGYVVDTAAGAAEMRAAMAAHDYALVVLDLMMRGEDGLTILRLMDRESGPAVILHSVIGEDVDRIVGLEMLEMATAGFCSPPRLGARPEIPRGGPKEVRELAEADIDEMRAMLGAVLRFTRDGRSAAAHARLDLGSLIESLGEDLAVAGVPVDADLGPR